MRRRRFLTSLFLGLITGTGVLQAATEYQVVGADGEPLRADFNRQVGKVRAVLLAAPT